MGLVGKENIRQMSRAYALPSVAIVTGALANERILATVYCDGDDANAEQVWHSTNGWLGCLGGICRLDCVLRIMQHWLTLQFIGF